MFVDGNRIELREPTQTQGEHANSAQKHPDLGLNPGPNRHTNGALS